MTIGSKSRVSQGLLFVPLQNGSVRRLRRKLLLGQRWTPLFESDYVRLTGVDAQFTPIEGGSAEHPRRLILDCG